MAALTYRFADVSVNNLGEIIQVDQTAANSANGGWKVAKTASGQSAEMVWGTPATAGFSSQSTTPKPGSAISGVGGNMLRSDSTLSGDFDAAAWTMTFAVRATTASSQAGRVRVRVFKSADPTGASGMTELTASTQVGTTSSALSTSADVTSVVTWTPASAIHFSNEYLFIAIAWEITTASGSNNSNVLLRTGTSTTGSRVVTSNFTAATAKSGSDGNGTTAESASVAFQKTTGTARISLSSVGTPGAGTVTLHVRSKMGATDSGVLDVALYQGATLIEEYQISPGTSFATDDHVVSNAGSITDWTTLEVRLQGISTTAHDTFAPQVSYIALEVPSGSTLISDTDSGSDSEAQTLTAQESGTDSGTSTEIIHPFIRTLPADPGTITDVAGISEKATDALTDTEAATVTVPVSGTDTGSDSEITLKIVISGITDTASDSEAFSETVQLPGSDAGSDTETGKISLLGADSGTETEAQTETAQLPGVETASDAETAKISEISSEFGSDTETQVEVAQISTSDQNTSTLEAASTGNPVSATDAATGLEVASPKAVESASDSASDIETPGIKISGVDSGVQSDTSALTAAIPGSDSASAVDFGSTNTQSTFTSSDAAGASENAQEVVSLAGAAEAASGADTASVRVFLNPSADSGSSFEAQVLTVVMILAEAGISIDSASPQISWTSVDSATDAEIQSQLITPLDSDTGIGSDGFTVSAGLLGLEPASILEFADRLDLTSAPSGFERKLIAAGVEQGVLTSTSNDAGLEIGSRPERGSLTGA